MQRTVRTPRRASSQRRLRLPGVMLSAAMLASVPSIASAVWDPPHRHRGESTQPSAPEPSTERAPTPATKTETPARQQTQAEAAGVPRDGVAIVIQKRKHSLTVFKDGTAVKEFPVVMGRNGRGPKRFEGDNRTPEGVYRVTEKHPHSRWRYFIGISYPNEYDVAAYAQAIVDGGVPVIDGEVIGIGGAVGIHGSDHFAEQSAGLDWTAGCIALRSDDVSFVYDVVDRGTPVLILP